MTYDYDAALELAKVSRQLRIARQVLRALDNFFSEGASHVNANGYLFVPDVTLHTAIKQALAGEEIHEA